MPDSYKLFFLDAEERKREELLCFRGEGLTFARSSLETHQMAFGSVDIVHRFRNLRRAQRDRLTDNGRLTLQTEAGH